MAVNYSEELSKYNALLSKNQNDTYALAMLARIAIKENRFNDAEDYYGIILSKDPKYAEALYMMAFFYMKKKQNSIAIEYLKNIIDIEKSNSFVYEYMAVLDKNNRKYYLEKSLEIAIETKISSKDYGRCSYIAFQSYSWGEYDVSLKYANLAYSVKATNDIINLLGCLYHYNGDYDRALSFFHVVNANYNGNNSYILCNISSCYKKKNSNKMAIRYLEKALKVDDNNKLIYYNIGSMYALTGNKKLAIENFEYALKIDSNYEEAKNALYKIKE